MSNLRIIHRPFLIEGQNLNSKELVWRTCLREMHFGECEMALPFVLNEKDEIYIGLEAEIFLAEVLSGLKSPLIGETEVFGQFKLWWNDVSESNTFKNKYRGTVDSIYSLVKSVREKVFCGHGSQSYGSLLRRHLLKGESLEILGSGHLVQEITPWLKGKTQFRIWYRTFENVSQVLREENLIHFDSMEPLSSIVVVAAPIKHDELNLWLKMRNFSKNHKLIDFRPHSDVFVPIIEPKIHLRLRDFSTEFNSHKEEIKKKTEEAFQFIKKWGLSQEVKTQLRPFGWDDL